MEYDICPECKASPCVAGEVCEKCARRLDARRIAVRLLRDESSEHYDERFTSSAVVAEFKASAIIVDALAAKLLSGEIVVPVDLPLRRRNSSDTYFREREAISVYRALGSGSRRRWDNNSSRR